tara:strand:- start:2954 stop:4102 length:1149 start_codon:yes stop_codon:yes gene_type:complete
MKKIKNLKSVLHLSHTDIRCDSRILKSMEALKLAGASIYGIGLVARDIKDREIIHNQFSIRTLSLFSRNFKIPMPIRHLVNLLEFYAKSIKIGIKLKPQIIHCNDHIVLPIALILKIFGRSKVIYDAHELESCNTDQSLIERHFIRNFERIMWPFIDSLIVVSPSIQKWYQLHFASKDSYIVLNSPSIKKITEIKNDYLRSKFNIDKETKIFVYVGYFQHGRGLETILKYFSDAEENICLVLLGYGPYLSKIKDYSNNINNIYIHDCVHHEKVVPILKSADIGICLVENDSLNNYYSLPNKFFEYIFAGLPVLASDFPDIKDLVERDKFGCCVNPKNYESVKEGIKKLTKSFEEYEIQFSNLEVLSWESQTQELLKCYSNLI